MSFKVNDKVTVVDSGRQYSTYDKWVKIYASQWMDQWMDCDKCIDTTEEYTVVAKGKHKDCNKMLYLIQCDDKVYIIGEQGIKAVETVGFKVGDEVKVTGISKDASHGKAKHIGAVAKIVSDDSTNFPYKLSSIFEYWFKPEELELVTEKDIVFTLKEAMKQCLDGHKVVPVNHIRPKSHMFFDGKGFMWYTESNGRTEPASSILEKTQWVLWTKPPKFTTGTLVYNTDGTIGKIMDDKGVYKGIRKYSVSFNAIRDTVKTVDETELTEYKQ